MSGTNSTDVHHSSSGLYSIAIILFMCLCMIVGIIGNVGVIVYNIFMNQSKTPTTYFVVNLAISDIIVCLTFFPSGLAEFVSHLIDGDINHRLICKIGVTSSFTSIALSIANLLVITVDRFIFISKPLKYPSIMTWKRNYILLVGIWLLAIVNANVILFNTEEAQGRSLFCRFRNPGKMFFGCINFFIPSLVLLYLNYKIYQVAKNQRRRIRHESCTTRYTTQSTDAAGTPQNTERKERLKQIKMVKTFAIVLGVFLCCILPLLIISFINQSICKTSCIPFSVTSFVVLLAGANSVMNPFIYSSRNKEYRIAYRQFFSRLCRMN